MTTSETIENLKTNRIFEIIGDLMESISCDGCKSILHSPFVNTCGHSICSECMEVYCVVVGQCIVCEVALAPTTMSGSKLWGEMSVEVADFSVAMTHLLKCEQTKGFDLNNDKAIVLAGGDLSTTGTIQKFIAASAITQLSVDLLASPPLTAVDNSPQQLKSESVQTRIPLPPIYQPPTAFRHHYDSLTQDQSISLTQASLAIDNHQPPPLTIAQPSLPTQTSLTDFDYTPKRPYHTQSQDFYTQGSFGAAAEEIERSKRRIEEFLNAENAKTNPPQDDPPTVQQQRVNVVTAVKAISNPIVPFTTPDFAARMTHNNGSESTINEGLNLNTVNCSPVVAVFLDEQQEQLCRECVHRGWIQQEGVRIPDDTRVVFITPVIEERGGYKLTSRSITYMKCLLLGYLIVHYRWLQDSTQVGSLLDPHDYEIAGSVHDTSFRAPFLSRFMQRDQGKINLFEGYLFTVIPRESVVGSHQLHQNVATDEDLAWLIKHAGGKLKDQSETHISKRHRPEEQYLLKHFTICAAIPSRTPPIASQGYQGLVVSSKWLFDAICNLRIPYDHCKYLVETTTSNEWKDVRAIT